MSITELIEYRVKRIICYYYPSCLTTFDRAAVALELSQKMSFYVRLLLAITGMRPGPALSAICKKGEKYVQANCERIFIWSRKRNNFISLLNVTLLNNYDHNFGSIRGKTVRVIADNMLPYITSSNYSQTLGGFLGEVWQMIESELGFTSNISSVHYDTGLNIITSGEADVMLAAVVAKRELRNIKYSQPYFYNWYHLYLKTPEARASSNSYLKTFDSQLWFVTIVVFAILTVGLWTSTKFLNSVCRIERVVSAPSCFLGVVSGFINQGFDLKLSSYSGRMQVMFALILGVVLCSAMNAVLVAQLAVFDIPFPFTSMDDIAHKHTHSLCLRSNSFVYNNFTNKEREILPLWRGVLNEPKCKDINSQENLASILCDDGVAVLENRAVMDMIIKKYKPSCEITRNQEKMFQTANSFLMLQSFEYNKLIVYMIEKMRSTGILQRLEEVWIRREKLVKENVPQSPQVTLDHIGGILVMYFALMLISLLVLVFERFHFRCTHPNDFIVYTD